MSRPSLLHLNGKRKNIQCARAEQPFGHVTEILRCHVVDICFDHDNVFSRSTAFCTEHKAVLAVNESAANVDCRAEESLDSKRIEPYRRTDTVHDRIHGADLMKFNIFGPDVVDLAFGNGELRKNIRRNSPCVRMNGTLRNHL